MTGPRATTVNMIRTIYYILFYKAKEINASSILGQAYIFFLLLMRVRECVCVLFYIIFFHHGMYFISY